MVNHTRILSFLSSGNFIEVREAAIKSIVDIVQSEQSDSDLTFLLDLIESNEPRIQ